MSEKTCILCGEVKLISEFYRAYTTVGGEVKYAARCKECAKAAALRRDKELSGDAEYREGKNAAQREWRRKNGLIKGRHTTTRGDVRACSRCKEDKPVGEFRNHKGKLSSWCKECDRDYLKHWQERNKDYSKQRWAKKRRLLNERQCKNERCAKMFQPETGRQKYCCDSCRNAKLSRDANQRNGYSKKRYALQVKEKPPKVRKPGPNAVERTCTQCGETKLADEFQKRRNICSICWAGFQRQNYLKHKAYYKEQTRKREMRRKKAKGFHTAAEWEALKAKYAYTCLRCGKSEPTISLTRDHVKPLILGGTDYIDNIQPLCHSCNSQKNAAEIDYR